MGIGSEILSESDTREKDFLEIVMELRGKLPNPEESRHIEKWNILEFSVEDLLEIPWELFEDLDVGWLDIEHSNESFIYEDNGEERSLQSSDIEGIIRNLGTLFEPCAWYQSPHFWGVKWGIYIREKCVIQLMRALPTIDQQVRTRCQVTRTYEPAFLSALGMLFLHELYHFSVDSCATHLAIVTNHPNLYINYFKSFYEPKFLTPKCVEESLATRYTYDRNKYLKIDKYTLEMMFDAQPDGYRHYKKWLRPNVRFGERKMVRKLINYGIPKAKLGVLPKGAWFETFLRYSNQISYFRGYRVPIYLVQSGTGSQIRLRNARMK